MEIFKFLNPTSDTRLEQGQLINDITDVMWIERYRDCGEFTIKAPLESGIRTTLPTGTLISHVRSSDVMIVENHEINDNRDSPTEVVITGRSFETFLESRVIGTNHSMPAPIPIYQIAAKPTWDQAVELMGDHIYTTYLYDQNDALPFVRPTTNVTGTGIQELRPFKRGLVYPSLIELLALEGLGVKAVRPGSASPFGPTSPDMAILVHKGTDRSKDIMFAYNEGDIDSADYLWSIKSLQNTVLVTGRWLETMVKGPETGYDRRVLFVDGSFIDSEFQTVPTGVDYTNTIAKMTTLGKQALAAQNATALAKAEISRSVKRYTYRQDFDLGDIITVSGDYDEIVKMQVIEYVEIEDSSGESSYPTLATI